MLEYVVLVPTLTQIQQLYDANRFLDAFQESSGYWNSSKLIDELSIEELILGGRLAIRLGGWRLSRQLLRAAYAREPQNPRVRYFSYGSRRAWQLVDVLREFEADASACSEDPEMQAAWLASHAVTFARLRDFCTARHCLERAHSLRDRDAWVWSCESFVLGLEDRWEEALNCAESAWEINPGAPFAAGALSDSLLNLRRVEEAAERLRSASKDCQSYEVVQLACWHQCAVAETLDGESRHHALENALGLAEQLPRLAPLADRGPRRFFSRIRLDIAELADDHREMARWAEEARIPFYRKVLSNLRQNPKGRRIRLPFHRAIQKHSACLPTSLGSALATVGVQLNPDIMAAEITFGGTTDWAAAEWLERRGFKVRFFPITPETAKLLIENGIGFVLTLEGDDNAHAVAVVGFDEAAGTLLIHDPMAYRTTEYLLEGLTQNREPLGIKGMAAVPHEKETVLDRLLPKTGVAITTAAIAQQRALALQGPSAARDVIAEVLENFPADPGSRLLRYIQAAEEGRTAEALLGFEDLLNQFPTSPSVRARLLGACRARGNTAMMREIIAGVVERGVLPGVQAQQDWVFPPTRYVSEYADMLRFSAETRPKSLMLLRELIRRRPQSAEGWHAFGDLCWNERDLPGALLSFRLASCLAPENEHYAAAYSNVLARNQRQDEAFGYLESRVRKFGQSPRAAGTWISWISCLENWGHPDRALSICSEAVATLGRNSGLLRFVVPFLARMGRWRDAEEHLHRLEKCGNLPLFREAAVEFYRLRGNLQEALDQAQGWVDELPSSMPARYALIELLRKQLGAARATSQAMAWQSEFPAHEQFEELYYRQLGFDSLRKKFSLLFRRVKHDRQDGWAWRELTFLCLDEYERANDEWRAKHRKRVLSLLSECDRTGPEDPATLRVRARWHQISGKPHEAIAALFACIERDPTVSYDYDKLWEYSAGLGMAQCQELWRRMEPNLLRSPGHLSIARTIIPLLAQRFGVSRAEQVASRWNQLRPDDPEIVEGLADLLLHHGHGRSDAERAYSLLTQGVEHFPYHLGLLFSKVETCRKLGRIAEAEGALLEIIRRHPENTGARVQLAWVHELRGEHQQAHTLLREAASIDPQNNQVSDALIQILIRQRSFGEAKEAIREVSERAALDVNWRNRAIQLLRECGDEAAAVATARQGVTVYPRGAFLWFLLGTTLNQLRRFAESGEIEECFRQSLSLNSSYFDAADMLSVLFVEQRRYEEAQTIMLSIQPRLSDSSPARGRIAWIHRQQGNREKAHEQMCLTVLDYPGYVWGWALLMDWLIEDKSWQQARELLREVPEQLRNETRFRRQRLLVLEKSGVGLSALDAEWESLLRDFPDDLPLHLHRYDVLREAKRTPAAHTVINSFSTTDEANPYYLARLVEVRAEEGKIDEAIAGAKRIFFAEAESSTWPCDYSWEALKRGKCSKGAYQEMRESLENKMRPTVRAFSTLCSYALEEAGTTKKIPQTRWDSWFPDQGVKELLRLFALADRCPWIEGAYRASVFKHLNDVGHYHLVTKCCKKYRAEAESDVAMWSELARAFASLKRRTEGRKLVCSWRQKRGVPMWVIANYVGCISTVSPNGLKEIAASCGDALRDLPHDHCARYLAHAKAEACALLGDKQGLRQTWDQYRPYFDCKENKQEWFDKIRRPLLTEIPMMIRFLEQNESGLYRKAVWRLRWRHLAGSLPIPKNSTGSVRFRWWWAISIWMLLQLLLRTLDSNK